MSDGSYISLRLPNLGVLSDIDNPHITLLYFQDTSPGELAAALPGDFEYGSMTLELTGTGMWRGRVRSRDPYWISYYSVDRAETGKHLRGLRDELREHLILSDRIHSDNTYDFVPHITRMVSTNPGQQLPALTTSPRYTVDTIYISQPGKHRQALTIKL